jgi:hypothetical protein
MSRYLEIYSKNRDRNQYPLTSQFGIPFTVAQNQNDDTVLSGAIYYMWSGTAADSFVNHGLTNVFSTDSAVSILPDFTSVPPVANALNGYKLTISNPVITQGQYGLGSTNANPILGINASSIDGAYIGNTIKDLVTREIRTITGYNGTTKQVDLDSPFSGSIEVDGTNPFISYDNGLTWNANINTAEITQYDSYIAIISGEWVSGSVGTGVFNDNYALFSYQNGSTYVSFNRVEVSGRSIYYGNGLWVIVGLPQELPLDQYFIITSNDGKIWTPVTSSPFDVGGYGVAYNGSLWVSVGGIVNSIAYSSDGMNWTGNGNSIFSTGKGIIWTGTLWYAVGTGPNTIAYSADGITWTGLGSILFTIAYSICYGNGKWIAVGEGDNTIAYSNDGITWTGLGMIFRNRGNDVKWNGSIFIATGNDYASGLGFDQVHSVFTSNDGVNWSGVENSSKYLLNGNSIVINRTTILPGNNYQIGGNSQSRLVIGYEPVSRTCIPDTSFDGIVPYLSYTLTDPSTVYIIHIPYEDINGNMILSIEQAYNGYYIVDETLSSGTSIIARQIIYYDFNTRLAYLETPFPDGWRLSDLYTLRKDLPSSTLILTPDLIPYINTDPSYGPVGPVIRFPPNALPIDSYYNGEYVYYTSLPTYDYSVYGQFRPVYGNYFIKSYKGSTKEAFVNYAKGVTITTSGTNYYNMPYPYLFFNGDIASGSNSDVILISQINSPRIPGFFKGYSLTVVETGETRYITDYDGLDTIYLNKSLSLPIQTGFTCTIQQTGQIDIVSFSKNNVNSLQYSGSIVSQSETVCYEISLMELTVPNVALTSGGRITDYPFMYVQLSNDTAPNRASQSLIYSNNPASRNAVFIAPVTDISDPATDLFIKLGNPIMKQTMKFKPNDNLFFSIFLPDGTLFQTVQSDTVSPYPANQLLQVHATFSIRRL